MKPNDMGWEIFPDKSTFDIKRVIRIKNKAIEILFLTEDDAIKIMPPFHHLETDNDLICDRSLRIYVFQNIEPGKNFPTWERLNQNACSGKKLQMYNRDTFHVLYNDESEALAAIDTEAAEAYYYLPQLDKMPYYEKAAPMRMIFHHWAQANGMILLHGAGIGVGGKGILLAGKGGSGKSTTAVSAALSGFDFIGDDYVLADPNGMTLHSLYCSSKIRWDAANILPIVNTLTVNQKEEDEKGIFFLSDINNCHLPRSMNLSTVILPSITGEQFTTYSLSTTTQALMSLASSTIFQMPGSGQEILSSISYLLRGIPVYRMFMSSNSDEINRTLIEIITNL